MGGGIPLPALNINPPKPVDPLEMFARVMQFRQMVQQAQLQRGQVQAQQDAHQLHQMQVAETARKQQENDLIRKSYVANNGDIDKVVAEVGQNPIVNPETLTKLHSDSVAAQIQLAQKNEAELKLHSVQIDNLKGAFQPIFDAPDEQKPALWAQQRAKVLASPQAYGVTDPSQIPEAFPGKDQGAFLMAQFSAASKQLEDAKTLAQTREAAGKGAQAEQETKNLQAALPKIQAESAAAPTNIALEQTQKRASIASTQASTAKTVLETENLGQQPIFALDPKTNQRVMTTRPEAQANGYTNPVPVKEGDVSKETDARAMINDVQLNKSRYLASMQQVYREPMSTAQKNALAVLTPEKLGISFGSLFKLELPDVIQKLANASEFSLLSKAQKEAVVGYYSTLASVPAAQKALTNIGRANKEMMDLELRTIPTPLMDQQSFTIGLDRFQGNIDQTARKTVMIPGMPSTEDIRATHEGNQQQNNLRIPQPFAPVTFGGR